MLMSIILAVVVGLLVMVIASSFENGEAPFSKVKNEHGDVVYDKGGKPKRAKLKVSDNGLLTAGIIAAVVGFVNYLTPKLGDILWLAPIFFIAMLAVSAYLIWWWSKEGSSFKEMIPFLLLLVPVYFTTMAAAAMTTGLVKNGTFAAILMAIPAVVAIGSLGFYVANLFFFNKEEAEVAEDEDETKKWNRLGWLAVILTILLILGYFFG